MPKPRKKKYNHNARVATLIDKSLSTAMVIFAHEMGESGLRFALNGKILTKPEWKIHANTLRCLNGVPHHWTIITGVLCCTPNGKEFIDYQDVVTQHRHYFEDLDSLAGEYIKSFYDRNNKEHILTCFYIGMPNKRELSEIQIINLLYEIGAGKLNTWYERNLIFNKAITELEGIPMDKWLSGATVKALNKNGVTHFGQIRKMGREAVLALNGIGETRLNEIYDSFKNAAITEQESLPNFFKFQHDEIHRNEVQAYFQQLEKHK